MFAAMIFLFEAIIILGPLSILPLPVWVFVLVALFLVIAAKWIDVVIRLSIESEDVADLWGISRRKK